MSIRMSSSIITEKRVGRREAYFPAEGDQAIQKKAKSSKLKHRWSFPGMGAHGSRLSKEAQATVGKLSRSKSAHSDLEKPDKKKLIGTATKFRLVFQELKLRTGLKQTGLYRTAGVKSKIKTFLEKGFSRRKQGVSLKNPQKFESEVLTSAVKQLSRDLFSVELQEGLLQLFSKEDRSFSDLSKDESKALSVRVSTLMSHSGPGFNCNGKEVLRELVGHLREVSAQSDFNNMTPENLGICFGPSLFDRFNEKNPSLALQNIKLVNDITAFLIRPENGLDLAEVAPGMSWV